ncbi:MAG: hypothetical protein MRK02_09480 [Candidatus Scalindua sp.]|nr:hypothetical protein [Candidatus Scalindua sp.]
MVLSRSVQYISILLFLGFSVVYADNKETETTAASGGNQIVVSPANILIDIGEYVSADVYVIDGEGNPIEGHKIQILPQDKNISVKSSSFVSNEYGYIHFFIFGKQEGDSMVVVSDGFVSSQINVAVRNLIHYVLPYFYGNMQLSIINPSSEENFAKIQFYENSREEGSRQVLPFTIKLSGKEMKKVDLAKELGVELGDGWAEILATDIIFGGVWTKKGYLPFRLIKEGFQ